VHPIPPSFAWLGALPAHIAGAGGPTEGVGWMLAWIAGGAAVGVAAAFGPTIGRHLSGKQRPAPSVRLVRWWEADGFWCAEAVCSQDETAETGVWTLVLSSGSELAAEATIGRHGHLTLRVQLPPAASARTLRLARGSTTLFEANVEGLGSRA
jgi:hypothetical protein